MYRNQLVDKNHKFGHAFFYNHRLQVIYNLYNQSEIVSGPDIAGILVFFTVISLYVGTILWHLSKPKPKDVKKRKKFYIKLLLIIFIPLIIVGILIIHSLANMSIDISLEDIANAYEEPS
mgnify:CR=1 FL=1